MSGLWLNVLLLLMGGRLSWLMIVLSDCVVISVYDSVCGWVVVFVRIVMVWFGLRCDSVRICFYVLISWVLLIGIVGFGKGVKESGGCCV